MNKELQELAAWVIKTAKGAGADHCRARISRGRTVSMSFRDGKAETVKESLTKRLTMEVYTGGKYSAQSTSDFRRAELKTFIDDAVAMTRLLAEDPHRILPDPKYYQGRENVDLGTVDPAQARTQPSDRLALVKTVADVCRENCGPKLISVTSSTADGFTEVMGMSSNGFEGFTEDTFFQFGAQATLQDEGNLRPMGYAYVADTHRQPLPSPESVGKEAARRALEKLGAGKIKTEALPVVIENQVVGRVLGGFLEALFGSAIQQKRSFLADKKGQKVTAPVLTLVDDPFVRGGQGSRLFDGDGLATKKRTILDAGVLQEFYIDWYYSRKLGCEPTVDGPSNLIIPPGKRSVAEILKSLKRAVLVTGFIGGNSNSTTGDASVGIFGRLFENGEPVKAIAEMNMAGNHLEFWNKVAEVANDPWPWDSERYPSLVLNDVLLSGL